MRLGELSIILVAFSITADPGYGEITNSELFQCRSSSEQSGQVFTPNIPDLYFNHENIASTARVTRLRRNEIHVFSFPSESAEQNCSGTVVGLQYCYRTNTASLQRAMKVFDLLLLSREGLEFTVTQTLDITSVATREKCSPGSMTENSQLCCETTVIDGVDSFQITSSNFTFGLHIGPSRLLTFVSSVTEFNFIQFRERMTTTFESGTTFNLSESSLRLDQSLPLLRFLIDSPEIPGRAILTPLDNDAPTTVATELKISARTTVMLQDNGGSTTRSTRDSGSELAERVAQGVIAGLLLLLLLVILTVVLAAVCILPTRRRAQAKAQAYEPTPPTAEQQTRVIDTQTQNDSNTAATDTTDTPEEHHMTVLSMQHNQAYGMTKAIVSPTMITATSDTTDTSEEHHTAILSMEYNQVYGLTMATAPPATLTEKIKDLELSEEIPVSTNAAYATPDISSATHRDGSNPHNSVRHHMDTEKQEDMVLSQNQAYSSVSGLTIERVGHSGITTIYVEPDKIYEDPDKIYAIPDAAQHP